MIQTILLLASLTLSSPAEAAQPFAQIIGGEGKISFSDRTVEVGALLSKKGFLKTGKNSRAKVLFFDSGATLNLEEKGKIQLAPPNAKNWKNYDLKRGSCRWVIQKIKKGKPKFRIRTPSAVMGVRGTDFLAKYDPIQQEVELVVFEGKVEFQSNRQPKSPKIVSPGEWLGLGGRFGTEVSEPKKIDSTLLQKLKEATQIQTTHKPKKTSKIK